MNGTPCPDLDSLTRPEMEWLQRAITGQEQDSTLDPNVDYFHHIQHCSECRTKLRQLVEWDQKLQHWNQQIPVGDGWLKQLEQQIKFSAPSDCVQKNKGRTSPQYRSHWWMGLATVAVILLAAQLFEPDAANRTPQTSPNRQEARKPETSSAPRTRLRSDDHLIVNSASTDEEIDIFVILPIAGSPHPPTITIPERMNP